MSNEPDDLRPMDCRWLLIVVALTSLGCIIAFGCGTALDFNQYLATYDDQEAQVIPLPKRQPDGTWTDDGAAP